MDPRRRLLAAVLTAAVLMGGLMFAVNRGWISPRGIIASLVPAKAALPTTPDLAPAAAVAPAVLPSTRPAAAGAPPVRIEVWAWNAQMGLMFANGGKQAAAGSLMCAHGVNLKLIREDSTDNMAGFLAAFAGSASSALRSFFGATAR